MATTFKTLLNSDIANTRTLLHEAIPVTGTIVSGTYDDLNIKTFAHGMYEAVFDYPFLSSSANHIFDISAGYSADSALSASSNVQNAKKINIYNQHAQVLYGYDVNGNVQVFDADGNIAAGGDKMRECFFLNFSKNNLFFFIAAFNRSSSVTTFFFGATFLITFFTTGFFLGTGVGVCCAIQPARTLIAKTVAIVTNIIFIYILLKKVLLL